MSVLIYGVLLFMIAFLVHVLVWRVSKPANTIRALIVLFGMILVTGLIILRYLAHDHPVLPEIPYMFIDYVHISLLYFSLFTCYLFSYPAIEADSPSLVIVMRIFQAGKNGLPCGAIKGSLGDDLLIDPRLKDLVNAKLVDSDGSIYKINEQGVFFIKPFMAFRKFMQLGKGG